MPSATHIPLFSSVLTDIYQAATSLSASAFEEKVFTSLRALIAFDKAVICFSGKTLSTEACPRTAQRSPAAARRKAVSGTLAQIGSGRRRSRLVPVSARTSMAGVNKHVVMYVADPLTEPAGAAMASCNWILLYRKHDVPVRAETSEVLVSFWPHLVNALHINLQRELDVCDDNHEKRALALVSRGGGITLADSGFRKLFEQEWPGMFPSLLPPLVWSRLLRDRTYKGRFITIDVHGDCGKESFVCQAHPTSAIDRLGGAERTVAQLVKQGLCHKEIALKMGTSPNTVRTQIARLYKKLDVHSKSSLAKALADC